MFQTIKNVLTLEEDDHTVNLTLGVMYSNTDINIDLTIPNHYRVQVIHGGKSSEAFIALEHYSQEHFNNIYKRLIGDV